MPKKIGRGLSQFTKFKCSYGTEVRVQESSAASAPQIWIFMEENPAVFRDTKGGHASCHLTLAQARRLAEALLRATKEHYHFRNMKGR